MFKFLLFIVSALTSGAVLAEPDPIQVQYRAALQDAKQPTDDAIEDHLVMLKRANKKLIWNDQGQVLMVTWSKAKYFNNYTKGQAFNLYGVTWLTAAPYLKTFCQTLDTEDLDLRLKQYMGMPTRSSHDAIIQLWVDPQALFRPCPDPSVQDSTCQLRIPLVGNPRNEGENPPPWYCPLPAPTQTQALAQKWGDFVQVKQQHLNWMCSNWRANYQVEPASAGYPWTALGYTYDWGNPASNVGASEFIAPAKTPVVFEDSVPTATYCGR